MIYTNLPAKLQSHPEILFVDGSYYTFFRYFALIQWYQHKNKMKDLETTDGCIEFTNKFRDLFAKKLKEIIKKLKLKNPLIVVALDCPRNQIWRKELFPQYKQHRHDVIGEQQYTETNLFKLMRNEQLFKIAGAHLMIKHPCLEADDCIALFLKQIRTSTSQQIPVTIITSDHDYLQLADSYTKIYNLKYKNLTDSPMSFKDKHKDLFCKIVMGDKSDGIPGVFKKCGIKTAEKLYENQSLFQERLNKENAYHLFEFNKSLIDFNMIPTEYIQSLYTGNYTTEY